jgi:hypothetical protein
MRQVEQMSADEAAVLPEAEREAQNDADAERTADATTAVRDAGIKPSSLGEAD